MTDFVTIYQSLPDERLLELHDDFRSLVPEAQKALLDEINNRKMEVEGVRAKIKAANVSIKKQKTRSFKLAAAGAVGSSLVIFTHGALNLHLEAIPLVIGIAISWYLFQWLAATFLFKKDNAQS